MISSSSYWQLEFSSCKIKVFVERKNKPSGTIERHISGQRFQKMGQAFSGIYTSELASICVLSAFHTFFSFLYFRIYKFLKNFQYFLTGPMTAIGGRFPREGNRCSGFHIRLFVVCDVLVRNIRI